MELKRFNPNQITKSDMKTQIHDEQISLHVSGHYPVRQLDTGERNEQRTIVAIPCGFEPLYIAVYGHDLSCDDCIDAAFEAWQDEQPEWMDWNNLEAVSEMKDSAYITS